MQDELTFQLTGSGAVASSQPGTAPLAARNSTSSGGSSLPFVGLIAVVAVLTVFGVVLGVRRRPSGCLRGRGGLTGGTGSQRWRRFS